jgi:hypothetical protein
MATANVKCPECKHVFLVDTSSGVIADFRRWGAAYVAEYRKTHNGQTPKGSMVVGAYQDAMVAEGHKPSEYNSNTLNTQVRGLL